MSELKPIKETALGLLARREHSRRELRSKLVKRYAQSDAINQVLDELEQAGWLSDARFAVAYISARAARGFGPLHIQNELQLRGVIPVLIEQAFLESNINWIELSEKVRTKRFGTLEPVTFLEKIKQQRFLKYRGFEFYHDDQ